MNMKHSPSIAPAANTSPIPTLKDAILEQAGDLLPQMVEWRRHEARFPGKAFE